ncbi:hypothetical protein U9M48_005929 [Paspalum notatum var. saurae]|uniref:Uncharacterized protein n=1 Tax=Paspalum notatum var. saurae TaxID=547442 RepID=A0AAQ3PWR5_PASNO
MDAELRTSLNCYRRADYTAYARGWTGGATPRLRGAHAVPAGRWLVLDRVVSCSRIPTRYVTEEELPQCRVVPSPAMGKMTG